jgi:NAD(P)H-nitrite reductase large subunit
LEGQSVSLSDGSTIKYSKLVVATGGIPRTLPLDGADLEGISIMRAIPDAQKIQSILSGASPDKKKTIALIGSSFISMELAIFAAKKENVQVHVIGMDKIPLSKILGDKIGNAIKKSHEKNGVVFHLEANLEKFLPSGMLSSKIGLPCFIDCL